MESPNAIVHLRTNFAAVLRQASEQTLADKLEVTDAYVRCLSGLPHPLGNIVIANKPAGDDLPALLLELEERAREMSVPVTVILFPDTGLTEKAALLEQRGWALIDNMPGMWMDLPEDFATGQLAEGVSVEHAASEAGLEAATQLLTDGYPIPMEVSTFFMKGIHLTGEATGGQLANFVARVDGVPAACSSVCIEHGVAGVYCVATLEHFRGRGLGTAITRAAMTYAAEQGARHALLHATEMGAPIYRKIGFVEQCQIPAYAYGL
jgi:GNAT superfamily N-acetyltransferase